MATYMEEDYNDTSLVLCNYVVALYNYDWGELNHIYFTLISNETHPNFLPPELNVHTFPHSCFYLIWSYQLRDGFFFFKQRQFHTYQACLTSIYPVAQYG